MKSEPPPTPRKKSRQSVAVALFVLAVFVLNHAVGGLRPVVYYLTNVLLRGLNTVLMFRLIGRLTGCWIGASAATLLAYPAALLS